MAAVFACRRCADCCHGQGGIILRAKDTARLAAHLQMTEQAFARRFTEKKRGKQGLVCGESGRCVFVGPGGCSIHPARPDICRAWPFFRGNLLDPVSFALARHGCPGMSKTCSFAAFSRTGATYLLDRGIFTTAEEEQTPAALLPEPLLRQLVENGEAPPADGADDRRNRTGEV